MNKLTLEIDRVGGQFQLSIAMTDEQGRGGGYRIAGPKYAGNSTPVLSTVLTAEDRARIRGYLDRADAEEQPFEPAPVVTDEAVEAAVDVLMDYGHNGLQCDPTPNFMTPVRRALEAAALLLGPRPAPDRQPSDAAVEAAAKASYEVLASAWRWLDLSDSEKNMRRQRARAALVAAYLVDRVDARRPLLDREAITRAIEAASSRNDHIIGRTYVEAYADVFADAVLALLNGSES